MGIYDRDYFREEQPPPGVRLGGTRSMAVNLIIINAAIFLLNLFTEVVGKDGEGNLIHWLGDVMALQSSLFSEPWKCYQLLTCGFAHGSILHILFNMYGLWLFGRDVEGLYGKKEFLRLYLVLIVLSGLAWVLIANATGNLGSVIGASGAVVGIAIVFCLRFPHRTMCLMFAPSVQFPAWVLGLVFVGIDVLGAMGAGWGNVAYSAHLAGAVLAFLYVKSGMNFGRLVPGRFSLKSLTPKPRLRIHEPEDESDYRELDAEADRILDKVHREGEASLTQRERRALENYSRRMRQKHR